MKNGFYQRFYLSLELFLGMSLLGLLLLSATLYYRGVRFQRFMEPMLAISRPKINFVKNVKRLLFEEFGTSEITGIKITADSILVDETIFKTIPHFGEVLGSQLLIKLSRVFLSILNDPLMIPYVDLILVNRNVPQGTNAESNKEAKVRMQLRAEKILRALYEGTPQLEKKFGMFFTATSIPSHISQGKSKMVEFRFIPTDRLHVDIINEFGKHLN